LLDIGFSYKVANGVRYLLEQPRIVLARLTFMRKLMKIRREGIKDIVCVDETWIYRRGPGQTKAWQDIDIRSCPLKGGSTGDR